MNAWTRKPKPPERPTEIRRQQCSILGHPPNWGAAQDTPDHLYRIVACHCQREERRFKLSELIRLLENDPEIAPYAPLPGAIQRRLDARHKKGEPDAKS